MALQTRHIYSSRQRWRDPGGIACFTWPANELVSLTLDVPNVGEVVHTSNKCANWRYRIAHGLNATTLYAAERSKLTYTPGHVYLGKWCGGSVQRFGYYQYDGDLFIGHTDVWSRPPAAAITIDPETRDVALYRAIQDARSKQNSFRGSNFVAELRDTIRGLRNPVKGFRRLLDTYHGNARRRVKQSVGRRPIPVSQEDFRKLEKSRPDVARAAQRALSDSWLEANFGWTPLLSDAVDAYHSLRRLSFTTPLARFQGNHEREDPPSYTSNTRNLSISPMHFTVRTVVKAEVKFYGAVKINTGTPSGRAVEEFGFRARDFVPAVWEAIPYSFIVDYFSNVGEIIECVSFPRSDLAWFARTYRNHSIRSTEQVAIADSSPAYPTNNGEKVFEFTAPRVEWDRTYIERNSYSGSAIPGFRFEIPGSKNWKKWCNIAALARLRTL